MSADIKKWFKKYLVSRYIMTECPDQRRCLKILEQILDDEAPDELKIEYKDHINECWSCYQDYKLEKAIRDLIKVKLEKKPIPENLLEEIKTRISESK